MVVVVLELVVILFFVDVLIGETLVVMDEWFLLVVLFWNGNVRVLLDVNVGIVVVFIEVNRFWFDLEV